MPRKCRVNGRATQTEHKNDPNVMVLPAVLDGSWNSAKELHRDDLVKADVAGNYVVRQVDEGRAAH